MARPIFYLRLIATGETQVISKPEGLGSGDTWFPVVWFPDGTRILGSSVRHTSDGQVFTGWTIPVVGSPPSRIRDDAFVHSISPDGSLIAFTAGRDRSWQAYQPDASTSNTNKEIWVVGTYGENARKVVGADDRILYGSVRWSPDGSRLAYTKLHLVGEGLPGSFGDVFAGINSLALTRSTPEAASRRFQECTSVSNP